MKKTKKKTPKIPKPSNPNQGYTEKIPNRSLRGFGGKKERKNLQPVPNKLKGLALIKSPGILEELCRSTAAPGAGLHEATLLFQKDSEKSGSFTGMKSISSWFICMTSLKPIS